jgi:Spy/CpxP family protein refolding chaperone
MKILAFVCTALLGLFALGTTSVSAQGRGQDTELTVDFNARQLDKYLSQYGDQLDLSRRQQKKIVTIEKRYGKKENKLSEAKGIKIIKRRELQKEKSEQLLSVLRDEQIEKLNQLVGRKGLFRKII